jgi:hypothetical protein
MLRRFLAQFLVNLEFRRRGAGPQADAAITRRSAFITSRVRSLMLEEEARVTTFDGGADDGRLGAPRSVALPRRGRYEIPSMAATCRSDPGTQLVA